jgi:hypothetical protein
MEAFVRSKIGTASLISGGAASEIPMPAILHWTGTTNAERWGLPRNDTATVDRSAALQAAINETTGTLKLPPGRFLMTGAAASIVARHGLIIEGQGSFNDASATHEGTTIVMNKADATAFVFTNCIEVQLRNVAIVCATTVPTSGNGILIDRTGSFGGSVLIDNVFLQDVYDGIQLAAANNASLQRVQLRNIFGTSGVRFAGTSPSLRADVLNISGLVCDNPLDNGAEYQFRGNWAASTAYVAGDMVLSFGNMYKCNVGGTSGGSGPTSKGTIASRAVTDGTVTWQFAGSSSLAWVQQDSYAYTLNVANARLINGAYGLRTVDGANTGTSYPIWLRAYDVDCDHSILGGVLLERGEDAMLTDLWVSSVQAGNGLTVASTHRGGLRLVQSEVNFSAYHGVVLDSGSTGNMIQASQIGHNSRAANNTYHGIAIGSTATDFQIIGNRLDARPTSTANGQAWGVAVSASTNDRYVIAHNAGRANATGLISDATNNATRVVTGNIA